MSRLPVTQANSFEDVQRVFEHLKGTNSGLLPPGAVIAFAKTAGGAIPAGYLQCNGSTASRTTYYALFQAVGTTFGIGDGSTTFTLPTITALATNVVYIIKT